MKKHSNNLVASIKKGIRGTFTFSGKSNQFEFITYFVLTVIAYYGGTILLFSAFETYLESMGGPLFFCLVDFSNFTCNFTISKWSKEIRRYGC